MSSDKKITLETSDKELFVVEEAVAMEFGTVKCFLDENSDTSTVTVVPLFNVSSDSLSNIIEYCKAHVEFQAKSTPEDEVKAYDAEFVKREDNDSIMAMILAANYLDIKELLVLLNTTVADRIKNKSVEYVRMFFGIQNDFTPQEEQKLRQENAWAFEGVDAD